MHFPLQLFCFFPPSYSSPLPPPSCPTPSRTTACLSSPHSSNPPISYSPPHPIVILNRSLRPFSPVPLHILLLFASPIHRRSVPRAFPMSSSSSHSLSYALFHFHFFSTSYCPSILPSVPYSLPQSSLSPITLSLCPSSLPTSSQHNTRQRSVQSFQM